MTTYEELVDLVRDWSTRDESVLPDSIIQTALRYAADNIYRDLKIPALEFANYYTVSENNAITYCIQTSSTTYSSVFSTTINRANFNSNPSNPEVNNATLSIPQDATSFIYLRVAGTTAKPEIGSTVDNIPITEDNVNDFCIIDNCGNPIIAPNSIHRNALFNERVDARTFHDYNDDKSYKNYYSRVGSNLICAGDIKDNDVFELVYYRRLPALDARMAIPYDLTVTEAQADPNTYEVVTQSEFDAMSDLKQNTFTKVDSSYIRYNYETPNWLKDENQKLLLYGSLHHCFDYLQEDSQSEKYRARFEMELKNLNDEEEMRKRSGGQATVTFSNTQLL